jgi:hypothetical protein
MIMNSAESLLWGSDPLNSSLGNSGRGGQEQNNRYFSPSISMNTGGSYLARVRFRSSSTTVGAGGVLALILPLCVLCCIREKRQRLLE